DHQILEPALLKAGHARFHQRGRAGQELMHAFLLVQGVDDWGVFSGEFPKALFAPRVGQAAGIENETAAVAGVVLRQIMVKGKAENAHDQIVRPRLGLRHQTLQFFRGQHVLEGAHQRRESDGQLGVVQQPANIFQSKGHALQEMGFALIKAAEAIGAQRLHDAHEDERVVVAKERFAIELDVPGEGVEIIVEELLAKLGREIGLGVKQQRGDVVLQRAFAAALIIHKERLAIAQHYIARLKIAVQEIVIGSFQQKIGQAAKVVLKSLLVERNRGQPEKIVFEVVQVPVDRLAVKTSARVADGIVQVAPGFDLKARQLGNHFAINLHHRRGDGVARTTVGKKFKERGVAEVFFEVCAVVQVLGVNFRHRQAVA